MPSSPEGHDPERELRGARAHMDATHEVLLALGRNRDDPAAVLDVIVERAATLCESNGAQLYLISDDALRISRVAGPNADRIRDYLTRHPLALDRSSLSGRVAVERRTQQISDVLADADFQRRDIQELFGFRTSIAAPLLFDDDVVGTLTLWRSHVDPFDAREIEQLESFATQATIVLRQAELAAELAARGRELAATVAELEVAGRHKSEFLASMSHELRTPLNAVIGFSDVLLGGMFGQLNERQEEYLGDIHSSGRHLLELLNEILDLSRIEAGQMRLDATVFSVPAALDYSLTVVRDRAAKDSVDLTSHVADDVGLVESDELRFKQVVVNLLGNAVKFTPAGGAVRLEAWREPGELVVAVSDTGVGIPDGDRERIFESFQQGGRGATKEEGTGLGLTLCRRIVELFGGRLGLESELGRGSTFEVRIPVMAYRPLEDGTPTAAGGGAILLVDDDRASLELMVAHLEGTGVQVLRAHDGAMALELARRTTPAGVVLDILLPGVDGWQVLRELQQDPVTAAIPVVIASVVDDRARGVELGAAAYLVKPFARDELVSTLRRVGVLPAESG